MEHIALLWESCLVNFSTSFSICFLFLSHNKADNIDSSNQSRQFPFFFKQLLFFPQAFWTLYLIMPPLGISNNKIHVNYLLKETQKENTDSCTFLLPSKNTSYIASWVSKWTFTKNTQEKVWKVPSEQHSISSPSSSNILTIPPHISIVSTHDKVFLHSLSILILRVILGRK